MEQRSAPARSVTCPEWADDLAREWESRALLASPAISRVLAECAREVRRERRKALVRAAEEAAGGQPDPEGTPGTLPGQDDGDVLTEGLWAIGIGAFLDRGAGAIVLPLRSASQVLKMLRGGGLPGGKAGA